MEVSAYAEKLVVAQQRTEKVLDEVRAYQDDLDGDLDAMLSPSHWDEKTVPARIP